jgi:hypothetical protein
VDDNKLALIKKLTSWLSLYLVIAVASIIAQVILAQKNVYMTPMVFASGIIGGCLSIQQRIKNITLDELRLYTESYSTLLIFLLTGGILSLLLYVAFLSGLIEGNLFPNFYMPEFGEKPTRRCLVTLFEETVPATERDLPKLLFWSFVAGFSERFVVKFINKTSGDNQSDQNGN